MKVRSRLAHRRCCFCHDTLDSLAVVTCPGCRATFHDDCHAQLRRCTTLGCPERRAAAEPAPRTREPDSPAAALASALWMRATVLVSIGFVSFVAMLVLAALTGVEVHSEDGDWKFWVGYGWVPSLVIFALPAGTFLRCLFALCNANGFDVRATLDRPWSRHHVVRRTERDSDGDERTILELRGEDAARARSVSLLLCAPTWLDGLANETPILVREDPASGISILEAPTGDLTLATLGR